MESFYVMNFASRKYQYFQIKVKSYSAFLVKKNISKKKPFLMWPNVVTCMTISSISFRVFLSRQASLFFTSHVMVQRFLLFVRSAEEKFPLDRHFFLRTRSTTAPLSYNVQWTKSLNNSDAVGSVVPDHFWIQLFSRIAFEYLRIHNTSLKNPSPSIYIMYYKKKIQP